MTPSPTKSLSFNDAVDLAMSLADFERSTHFPGHSTFHLERVDMLAAQLDDVHLATPAIHVAGTKGKGSVSALITSALSAAGYTVGLYTSPHLHTVLERIRVGMEPITKRDYAALIAQIWPAVERVEREGQWGGVTFFEMMTVLAMLHCRNIGADFHVLEVGLGGRLDATNIVMPEVSVITSISIDHAATLGDTIELIATEKAGIIKPGVPCVIAPQHSPDATRVFERIARERGSPMVSVSDRFAVESLSSDLREQSLALTGAHKSYTLTTPLIGDHQLENVATAVAAVEVLRERGFEAPDAAIERGVRDVRWPGRFEVYERDGKTIVLDGAHNPYSISRLVETVRQNFDVERVVLVFGSLGGHSAAGMLRELAPLAPETVAVQSRHPRSARAPVTADTVRAAGLDVVAEGPSVAEGLLKALDLARPEDLVLCAGSLAVAAETIEQLEGIEPEIYENLVGPVNRPPNDNR